MTAPPSGVVGYFRSAYPLVTFKEDWLEGCWEALTARHPALPWTDLKKKVENQLLLSDLSDSTRQHDRLLPPPDDGFSGLLFANERVGVLVQVMEIVEIGHSALSLLEIHRNNMEDKKYLIREGRANRRALMDVEPTQVNENGQNDAQNDAAAHSKGFPRSMLRLVVSDGYTEYPAIEYKRIPALSMDETPLGAKLFLRNVRSQRGVLFLDSQSCILKPDSRINALNSKRDELLEEALLRRIRPDAPPAQVMARPRIPPTRGGVAQQVDAPPRAPPTRSAKPSVKPKQPSSSALPASTKPKVKPAPASATMTVEELDELLYDDHIHDDMLGLGGDSLQPPQSARRKPKLSGVIQGGSETGKGKAKGKTAPYEVSGEVLSGDDDDEALWQAAEALSPARPVKRANASRSLHALHEQHAMPEVESQVIEIDDSDGAEMEVYGLEWDEQDEEQEEQGVERNLIRSSLPKPLRSTSVVPSYRQTGNVIEIDSDD